MVEAGRPGPREEGRGLGIEPQETVEKAGGSGAGGASVLAAAEPPPTLPPGARFRAERFLGAAAMSAICLITLGNVVARYFTDISFAFTEEVSVFLLVFLTFVGSAKAFLDGNQMAVTYFVDKLSWPWRRRALLFGLAMSAVMIGMLVWFGARMAWDDFDMEVTSPGLGWQQWIYTIWLPLLALLVLGRIAQGFVHVWKRR